MENITEGGFCYGKYKENHGTHIYMKLEIDGKEFEVDCYLRNDGRTYKTTADGTKDREKVIKASNQLY